MTDAYIYDALRSPRGKGRKDGSLHEVTSLRLSAQILNAVKDRNGLDGHAVEDVIWGNVTQVMEQGGCLARTTVLASDLDETNLSKFAAELVQLTNRTRTNGGPLFGVKGPVILGHGSSRAEEITAAVSTAIRYVQLDLVDIMRADLESMNKNAASKATGSGAGR